MDEMVRQAPPRGRSFLGGHLKGGPWLHVLLFALTLASAMYSQMPRARDASLWQFWLSPLHHPALLLQSLPFALTFMAILLAHEMGHFLTARHHGVSQSLPFFIPAPTIFGTFGAVILMRSQPPDKRTLLKVAVMGPYAGVLLAIPAAAWGLAHSVPIGRHAYFADGAQQLQGSLEFGGSILFNLLEAMFSPNGDDIILHPVATAGWVGLFITSLNLIPAAQLDGGHVAYALFGRRQVQISLAVVIGMLSFGLYSALLGDPDKGQGGAMWILWAILLFLIGLRHPPVQDESAPLSGWDKANGALALLLFILTFIPVPVSLVHSATMLQLPSRSEQELLEEDDFDAPDVQKMPVEQESEEAGEEFNL